MYYEVQGNKSNIQLVLLISNNLPKNYNLSEDSGDF